MRPAEFRKISETFNKEQLRWESLKEGDIIYNEQPIGYDVDYYKMKIDTINVEERNIIAHDVVGNHKGMVFAFLTEEEFNKKMK